MIKQRYIHIIIIYKHTHTHTGDLTVYKIRAEIQSDSNVYILLLPFIGTGSCE